MLLVTSSFILLSHSFSFSQFYNAFFRRILSRCRRRENQRGLGLEEKAEDERRDQNEDAMPRECSFESRLQRLSRLRLRQTSSNISSSSTRTLARDNLVNFSTLLVDPCSVLVLECREPRLNSLKDLLLRVEEFECRLVLESFEEDSISRLRLSREILQ